MHLLNRHSGVFQSLAYALASIFGSLFSAVSLIILSRALGPTNFGAFSVAFSLTQITSRLADFGLSVSLQRFIAKKYHDDSHTVASVFTWATKIKLASAVVALVVGLIFGRSIGSQLFGLSDPRFASLGISLAGIIIFYEFIVLLNQSIHQFRIAAILNFIQAALKFAFGLAVLFLFLPTAYQSYIWYGILPLIATVYGYYQIPIRFRRWTTPSAKAIQEVVKTAKFSYIAALAITFADQVDILIIKTMLDEYQTGLFAAASRISLMFTMFALSVGSVLNTRVARYKHHHLTNFYKKCLIVAIGAILSTPIFLIVAKVMLLVSAGHAYLEALTTVRLLLISTTIAMATVPLTAVFYSLDHPRYFMFAGLLQIGSLVAADFLLIPTLGIRGAAWAKIIMRFLVLFYTIISSYQSVRQHQHEKT